MPQPLHLCDQVWKDTETLVHRLESQSRSLVPSGEFYEDLVSGLRFACGAATSTLSCIQDDRETSLARSGISLHASASELSRVAGSEETDAHQVKSSVRRVLPVHENVTLRLDLGFDQPVALSTEEHLNDLLDVLLSFLAPVFLRQQFDALRKHQQAQSERDQLLNGLNEGTSLQQSFTSIAATLSTQTSADRVSLIRLGSRGGELVATSTQPKIDRRTLVARSLETLANATRDSAVVSWPTDATDLDTKVLHSLEDHSEHAGCRYVCIRTIYDENQQPVTSIILEWLRDDVPVDEGAQKAFWNSVGPATEQAVRRAIERRIGERHSLVPSFAKRPKRIVASVIALSLAGFLLATFPMSVRIPAEGTVVASERSRLFAPVDAVVADVLIKNHQIVDTDQKLIRLTSAELEQTRAEIEGKLATRRTQEAANLATRSASSRSFNSESNRPSSISADDRVLKTEIKGLESQLALIERQESELLITSPISGQVDGWNVQQSLLGRPVARGQHLFDILPSNETYHIELQIPDRLSGYLAETSDHTVAFRLRSDPTVTYHGVIDHVAKTSHQNISGESFIRCKIDLTNQSTEAFRHGATVIAQIEGPKRSIGFVWFRHIIQWSRENIWL